MAAIKALAALKAPRFRSFFAGQALSILGTWVQSVAMSWLVYRLTGSAVLLGVTAFLSQAPQLVISPLAGLFIDRFDRRRLFLTVQALMIAQASLLAAMTALGMVTPAHLVVLAALFGVLNSFDTPLRQSMLGGMVEDRALLRSAIALNASLFNSARFIGPPLAGLILAFTSESWCFAINAASFLGVAFAVWRQPPQPPATAPGGLGEAFRQGLAFAWTNRTIRTLLLSVAGLNLAGSAYVVLMPILAKESFGGDARTLGWLLGATGGGALAATMLVATRHNLDQLVRLVVMGWVFAALGLGGLGLSPRLEPALAAAFCIGLGISSVNVSTNSLLQSMAPDAIRGRVISYFTALRFGMDALGGLAAGTLAAGLGVAGTLGLEAGLVAVGTAVMAGLSGRLRRDAAPPLP
ncbi:putative transporter [Paramagnetospirillum magnetotacticum MS-1]|uniref:Putative transporter n=1 Tax=Paramagnetospirillum magnetotacticum MS-1 TaxID=272627 RepID=A0A0C2UCH6_PARME|nr:MFS transporter [Paramagnetospirillum magnetotacticum]KIL99207.1 putative transporter [Paramagnetospirillum magnetotacticum MS-1]